MKTLTINWLEKMASYDYVPGCPCGGYIRLYYRRLGACDNCNQHYYQDMSNYYIPVYNASQEGIMRKAGIKHDHCKPVNVD
jgi:hypothetical protein